MADDDDIRSGKGDIEHHTHFNADGIEVDLSDEWKAGKAIETHPEGDGVRVRIEMIHRTTGEVRFFEFFHRPF